MFGTRVWIAKRGVALALKQYFEAPAVLRCGDCNGTEFWIYLDNGNRTGMALFQCKNPNCQKGCPPIELHKPQMSDVVADKLGLYVPEPWLSSAPRGSSPTQAEKEALFSDMGGSDDDDED